jgi:hypothetical protein
VTGPAGVVSYAEHHRLEASGTFGDTENFSFGIRVKHRAGGADDNWSTTSVQAWLDVVGAPALSAYFQRATTGIGNGATMKQIRLFQVDRDGTRNKDHLPGIWRGSVRGEATGGNPHPWQCAVAVSMLCTTETSKSARHGRFYLPAPTFDWDNATDQIGAASRAAAAASAAQLLKDLNAGDTGTYGNVRVVLAGNGVRKNFPDTPGEINDVDQVAVGSVFDTIRSRRNQVVEVYSRVAIPGA